MNFLKLLLEYKDVFALTYKDLKNIHLELAQHCIELDSLIPLAHHARYRMNPNYVVVVKQDINKLLATRFIQLIEEATWLSPLVVVPKKNGKLRICVDFKKLNVTTKKDPYPLLFTNEVLNILAGHDVYSFLNGHSKYHQIFIIQEDKYKTTFVTN
jgi:hypothetical protein